MRALCSLSVVRTAAIVVALAAASFPTASRAQTDQAGSTLRIGGTGSALGAMHLLAQAFMKTHPDVHVSILPSLGSGGGIKALAAGKINIAVSARPLKDKERAMGIRASEYARTPIVFATRYDNMAESLALKQIEAAYSSEHANWPDGTQIRLILRPATETDIELVRGMSPVMDEAVEAALKRSELYVAINDQDNATALEKVPGSLGLTSLGQILTENRRIKPLALDGVEGTPDALRSGSYPHAKVFYLVERSEPEPAATAFAQFVRSTEGQAILVANGHLTAGAAQAPVKTDMSVGQ
ncbi:MAG: substrate-binding domain-containing protein [Nitratireductor sp.]|nr:substrate-binding domain-containing protein [Nitratireductor sp.]